MWLVEIKTYKTCVLVLVKTYIVTVKTYLAVLIVLGKQRDGQPTGHLRSWDTPTMINNANTLTQKETAT